MTTVMTMIATLTTITTIITTTTATTTIVIAIFTCMAAAKFTSSCCFNTSILQPKTRNKKIKYHITCLRVLTSATLQTTHVKGLRF